MNAKAFYDLVVLMRQAQKDFYDNGHQSKDLRRAKALERRVDEEIERVETILGSKPQPVQLEMFGNDNPEQSQ